MPNSKAKKVAVVVPWHGYGQNILLGVSKFVHSHPDWVLHLVQSDSPVLEADLRSWKPDGRSTIPEMIPSGIQLRKSSSSTGESDCTRCNTQSG